MRKDKRKLTRVDKESIGIIASVIIMAAASIFVVWCLVKAFEIL